MEKTSGAFPQSDSSEIFNDSEGVLGNLNDEIQSLKECITEATLLLDYLAGKMTEESLEKQLRNNYSRYKTPAVVDSDAGDEFNRS